jgi:two-component system chemotaxis response regulator CheB
MAALRKELIPKIKQFIRLPALLPAAGHAVPARPASQPGVAAQPQPRRRQIVAIGVSTGGPTALAAIVPTLPVDLRVPIVIVQHMPPMFTAFLAERLQKQTSLRVVEATDGAAVVAGTILIAPGDFHLRIRKNGAAVVASLNQQPPENSCRPAVDVLFRSVAEVFGDAAIGVVLTGMGQDGLRGSESLRARGAYIIAQDEATSVVWGMPGAIVRAELADAVVSLSDIVPEVLRHL